MRPRSFVRVNDDLLLVEIIRRLRHQPVAGVDYVAYPGVETRHIIAAAAPFFKEDHLRDLLQQLLDNGSLVCTGRCGQNFSPESRPQRTRFGLVKWLHPDAKLETRTYFTPAGTPLSDRQWRTKYEQTEHMFYVGARFWYITSDGLPKNVQHDVRLGRVIFDRTVHPWTVA